MEMAKNWVKEGIDPNPPFSSPDDQTATMSGL